MDSAMLWNGSKTDSLGREILGRNPSPLERENLSPSSLHPQRERFLQVISSNREIGDMVRLNSLEQFLSF